MIIPGKKIKQQKTWPVVFMTALFILLNGCVFALSANEENTGVMLKRFPDIHGDQIVFVSGEDIWTASVSGGAAVRLTIHDGIERYPKFSPDGSLIAFTGEYDGNSDVYVMDRFGGHITRLTYHPGMDQVVGWNKVKNKIIFTSGRNSYSRFQRLFMISADGSGIEELPMPEASAGSFNSTGDRIAYNKVPREHRTWKRYRGGLAQEIHIIDLKTLKEKNISNFAGTDRTPMWIGDNIYFVSDRRDVLNIFKYDTRTGQTEQVTSHRDYDVRRASSGGERIVYEVAGDIWMLDTRTGQSDRIPVSIRSDAPSRRPVLRNVARYITNFDLAPDGGKIAVAARGEIFTVNPDRERTVNLTDSSGSREKDVAWAPDGKHLAYISDRSGEYDIYITDPAGREKPVALTSFKSGYRHTLRWSPDSSKIAFTDQALQCWYVDVKTRKLVKVDKADYEHVDVSLDLKPIYDFTWSPDSRYIAYSKMNSELVYQVFIFDTMTQKKHPAGNGLFNDFGPVFSSDGNYLFFISNRRFDPTLCDFEWQFVYKNTAGIYCLALNTDAPVLFPDVKAGPESEKKKKGKSGMHAIDFSGLTERVSMVPLPAGNYRNLAASDNCLFYLNGEKGDYNRFEFRGKGEQNLNAFDFTRQKETQVRKNIDAYVLSGDKKTLACSSRGKIFLLPASARNGKGKAVDTSQLKMKLVPLEEWKQIFNDAWRFERDFYYEKNMHGSGWDLMRKKYGALMERASCRQDVVYIIGELIGELNTSHTYVYGGDMLRRGKRVSVGMLGVDWTADSNKNRYKIKKIYRVADWTGGNMTPLQKYPGKVKEGDYLLKVNGTNVTTDRNIYSYFTDMAGKPVELVFNSKAESAGAVTVMVKPAASERVMRYLDWTEHNRQVVEKASDGNIGYIHLPDTYLGSAREFPKYFYTQTRKKGIIVDGRFNGGGLDPVVFLQRLAMPPQSYWTRRYSKDQTSPFFAPRAHLALLTNRQAGSGGDMLPNQFKQMKLGPVIGTRTWGGLVGVSQFIGLVDQGGITAPDYRIYDENGNWVVENVGVVPDIEVDITAAEMARGHDGQLMTAVEYLKKKIKAQPKPWPQHPQFPVDKGAKK